MSARLACRSARQQGGLFPGCADDEGADMQVASPVPEGQPAIVNRALRSLHVSPEKALNGCPGAGRRLRLLTVPLRGQKPMRADPDIDASVDTMQRAGMTTTPEPVPVR
jgi:hypothetical protein